jgi:acetylornithine deacetylase
MSSLHVVKLGSSTILESSTIYDELAELVRRGARVVVVAGGALGIERHYQALGRAMRFLELKNGESFRHCPPDEMEAIRGAYRMAVLPRLARELEARGLAVFAATADQHGLVSGRQNKPVRAVVNGRDVILRDHRAGSVTSVRRAALEA